MRKIGGGLYKKRIERQCRRQCWTQGNPVRLSDDAIWYLPKINLFLVASVPGLIGLLGELLDVIDEYQIKPDDDAISARYWNLVRQIGQTLLRCNYDVSEDSMYDLTDIIWNELIIYDRQEQFAEFTTAVDTAIASASKDWLVLLDDHDTDTRKVLFPN